MAALQPLPVIQKEDIAKELSCNKLFLQGVDSAGNALLVLVARNHDAYARNLEEFEKLLVYGFTSAVKLSGKLGGRGGLLLLFDLHGYSMFQNSDLQGIRSLIKVYQTYFVGRIRGVWVFNAPSSFWVLWKSVTPFLPVNVLNAVKFMYTSSGSAQDEALKMVPAEVLPVTLGGQAKLTPLQECVEQHSLHLGGQLPTPGSDVLAEGDEDGSGDKPHGG